MNSKNDDRLNAEFAKLVERMPLKGEIFLPTEKIPMPRRVAGLKETIRLIESGELETKYRQSLNSLKSAFESRDRCFIIGNGPSLKNTDLSWLEGEVTFVTNGFFLNHDRVNWTPTFYVVEDHLVAEDRAEEIQAYSAGTKLFPAYLRYVIEPSADTVFFNHMPRPSYPDGFDFSFNADEVTYAGGTVVFTCMQLAAFLGFKEIFLVGVDADYQIPHDAELSGAGRVKEIDMRSDDPNHFHPDYFGKGKRWHEPNVDIMTAAYREAFTSCRERGISIYNATVGGKLEVFPRVDYAELFEGDVHPRLLLFDMTQIGNGTATGELKATLFRDWPDDRLMQVFSTSDPNLLGIRYAGRSEQVGIKSVQEFCSAFDPDLILYRPLPDAPEVHDVAMNVIGGSDTPLVVWVMDDWLQTLQTDGPSSDMLRDWEWLVQKAQRGLAISADMADVFSKRYGLAFDHVANGVEISDWPKAEQKIENRPISVRFAGSLSDRMSLQSVLLVAKAVESLASGGEQIEFLIKTSALWAEQAGSAFQNFKHTAIVSRNLDPHEYRQWLSDADVVLIAYNFDERSREYTRYSVANKLPECLASGAVVLGVGPAEMATFKRLEDNVSAVLVSKDDVGAVAQALSGLASDPARRYRLAQSAQNLVCSQFSADEARSKFEAIVKKVSPSMTAVVTSYPRDAHAGVNETKVVACLMSDRDDGAPRIMLDIGAHSGGSADMFVRRNWRILCYEPDPTNRSKLVDRFGAAENISIDERAVSDVAGQELSFFTSDESTGISGLLPFHDTHVESSKVMTTTVGDIVRDHEIPHVDFLKIDVEGYDLNVLKGVPWDTHKPTVIECEFEDRKTLKLGHDWKAIADYLVDKGYTVYVSEWHPIVKYGIRHDWKRMFRYPDEDVAELAWGNMLAFLNDPGTETVKRVFEENVTSKSLSVPRRPAISQSPPPSANTHFIRVVARQAYPRRGLIGLALILVLGAVGASFLPAFAGWRTYLHMLMLSAILGGALALLAYRTFVQITALRREVNELKAELKSKSNLDLYSSRLKAIEEKLGGR